MAMKRKEVDAVDDDFSDFSLSSPAPKIRRLLPDTEFAPNMQDPNQLHHHFSTASASASAWNKGEEEKAIIVYKQPPANPNLLSPTSNFSLSVASDFISGFKDQFLRSTGGSVSINSLEEEEEEEEEQESNEKIRSMAVVPWVPTNFNLLQGMEVYRAEAMEEGEQDGVATMDIEDMGAESSECGGFDVAISKENQGLPQWQQQHCFIPNPPPYNISTPISWSHC